MVTKPNTPIPVSGEEPLKKMPKVAPMEAASGFAFPGAPKTKLTDAEPKTFKLPENVSASDIKADSFRYGGGRVAGGGTPSAPDRAGRRS